jgi:hypothetical protein
MSHQTQRAALTRAVRSGNVDRVAAACRAALAEWSVAGWPDDWADWSRALEDVQGWPVAVTLDDLGQGLS